jgi:cytochrome c oxidase assembly protein subunit 15
VQILLGVSNIVYSLPLAVAVAHNAVAACLLLVMVMLTYTLYRKI